MKRRDSEQTHFITTRIWKAIQERVGTTLESLNNFIYKSIGINQ